MRNDMKSSQTNKNHVRWKIKSAGAWSIFLLAVCLVGLNIGLTRMERQYGWRKDYSFNGITTQSETTGEVLAELSHPVHIYALFAKGQEDAPLVELLDRYAASSDLVTWEQADPGINPMLLSRFSSDTETVSADSLIVYCAETDRWRILSPAEFISLSMDEETGTYSYAGYTYEQAITSALMYVTREKIPRIVVSQGHGELDGETLLTFERLMSDNHYEVVYRRLSDAEYQPDPDELIAFFSPMRDLSSEEMDKLKTFIDGGGSFLFTCDYTDPVEEMPNYASLLRSYGIIPKDGIVIADQAAPNTYYNQVRIDLIPDMKSTDVTMDLIASGADTVLLPGSRAFETPETTDRNLMVMPVLESGETSYIKKINEGLTSMEKTEDDESGAFPLMLQARRVTAGGYVSKAFAVGCSSLLTEEQIFAMTDARQLVIRMIEYLTGQQISNLNIMAKSAVRPGLSPRGNGLGSVIVAALPLSVLLFSLAAYIRRRNL